MEFLKSSLFYLVFHHKVFNFTERKQSEDFQVFFNSLIARIEKVLIEIISGEHALVKPNGVSGALAELLASFICQKWQSKAKDFMLGLDVAYELVACVNVTHLVVTTDLI
jgi:hypothetical protein